MAAARDLGLGLAGSSNGLFAGDRDKRIDPAIEPLDTLEAGLRQLNRGKLTSAYQAPGLSNRQPVKIAGAHVLLGAGGRK